MQTAVRWNGWDRQGLDHCLLRRYAVGGFRSGAACPNRSPCAPAGPHRSHHAPVMQEFTPLPVEHDRVWVDTVTSCRSGDQP